MQLGILILPVYGLNLGSGFNNGFLLSNCIPGYSKAQWIMWRQGANCRHSDWKSGTPTSWPPRLYEFTLSIVEENPIQKGRVPIPVWNFICNLHFLTTFHMLPYCLQRLPKISLCILSSFSFWLLAVVYHSFSCYFQVKVFAKHCACRL